MIQAMMSKNKDPVLSELVFSGVGKAAFLEVFMVSGLFLK
jgi:hypothetical protein